MAALIASVIAFGYINNKSGHREHRECRDRSVRRATIFELLFSVISAAHH
jgi:hypothetical protein